MDWWVVLVALGGIWWLLTTPDVHPQHEDPVTDALFCLRFGLRMLLVVLGVLMVVLLRL